MFGNGYGPYGFSGPFGSAFNGPVGVQNAQQSLFNPVTPAPAPQPPAPSAGPDWIPVTDIKQVDQVQVSPGGKAWVMLQNEPIFALRVADQMGLVTTSYYRFEKIDPSVMSAPQVSQDYVTRAEFQQFVDSLRASASDGTGTAEKGTTKK